MEHKPDSSASPDPDGLEQRLRSFLQQNEHALPQDAVFYEAMGRAIGAWAQVEGALYAMFLAALNLPHEDPAAAAFHAIVSFQGRLKMVDSAMQASMAGTPLLERWRPLEERIGRIERRRNQVAHFMPRRDSKPTDGERLYLGPHPYDVVRTQKAPRPIFTEELLAIRDDVHALATEMTWLALSIATGRRQAAEG